MAHRNRALWTAKLAGKPVRANKGSPTLPTGGRGFTGVVLGIDPSLRGTGLAVGRFVKGELAELLESQTVKLAPGIPLDGCCGHIWRAVSELCQRHPVDVVAMERAIHAQNHRTAIIMGSARGAAMAATAVAGLEVTEYSPREIKGAITVSGSATKAQVAAMVRTLCQRDARTLPEDEADATAVAICHAARWREPGAQTG